MNNNKQIKSATVIFREEYKKRSGKDADETTMQHMDYCIRAMHKYTDQFINNPIPQQQEQLINYFHSDLTNENTTPYCSRCHKAILLNDSTAPDTCMCPPLGYVVQPENYDPKYYEMHPLDELKPETNTEEGDSIAKEICLSHAHRNGFYDGHLYDEISQAVQQERERVKEYYKILKTKSDWQRETIKQLQSELEAAKVVKVPGIFEPENDAPIPQKDYWLGYAECLKDLKQLNPKHTFEG